MYGPFSAMYPGNSYGAVTEITTRMPKQFEGSIKVSAAAQDFSRYGANGSYPAGEANVNLGNRSGDLSWWFSANHLDSFSQPISYATIAQSTTPAGATADVSGLDIPTACVTPCVVQAKRSADIIVTIDKEGYEPQVVPLIKEIPGTGAAGFAGNLLLGGVVGMGVDAVTGAALDHKPNPVIVTLQPIAPPPQPVKPRAPKRSPPPPQS